MAVTISERTAQIAMEAIEAVTASITTQAENQMDPIQGMEILLAIADLDRQLDYQLPEGTYEKTEEALEMLKHLMSEQGNQVTEEEEEEEPVY